MNKQLYNNIIYNISKAIKQSLNEEIQNFDVTDYSDTEQDIIDSQTVSGFTGFDYSKFNDLVNRFNSLDISEESKEILQPIFSLIINTGPKKYKRIVNYQFYNDRNIEFDNIDFLNKIQKFNKNYKGIFDVYTSFFNNLKHLSFNENRDILSRYIEFVHVYIYYNSNVKQFKGSYCATGGDMYRTGSKAEAYIGQKFFPQSNLNFEWQIKDIDDAAKTMYEFIDLYIKYIEKNIDEIKKFEHQLYNKLIYNISKGIKESLNEDIQNFNPVDYNEYDDEIIDNDIVETVTGFDYDVFNDMARKIQNLKIPKKLKRYLIPDFLIYKQYKSWITNNEWNPDYIQKMDNSNLPAYYNLKNIAKEQDKSAIYKLSVEFSFLNFYNYNDPWSYEKNEKSINKCKPFILQFISDNKDIINNLFHNDIDSTYDIDIYCIYVPEEVKDEIIYRDKLTDSALIKDINQGLKHIEILLNKYIDYLEKNIKRIKRF